MGERQRERRGIRERGGLERETERGEKEGLERERRKD